MVFEAWGGICSQETEMDGMLIWFILFAFFIHARNIAHRMVVSKFRVGLPSWAISLEMPSPTCPLEGLLGDSKPS